MALRFRRSFRIAPGLRMNVSGSGVSWSVGPRGASVIFGKRGTYLNTSIPGTGLSSRSPIAPTCTPSRNTGAQETAILEAKITVKDDGTIRFLDVHGQPLPQTWVDKAKREHGEAIRNLIQQSCDRINARVEVLTSIHLQTPPPHRRLRYAPQTFSAQRPGPPPVRPHGLLGWLFKSRRVSIDSENAMRREQYETAAKQWCLAKAAFEERERARKELLEKRVLTDMSAMKKVLEDVLKGISWPREIAGSVEVRQDGRLVMLEIDLPEIEQMPKTMASVPSRGYKLTVNEMNAGKVQKLYMGHVHGIGFRLIGEAFAALPAAHEVVLSAFSQRSSKTTGNMSDEYLYSVRVSRTDWSLINFARLQDLDVVAALERFELKRDMTKTGLFRPISPIMSS